jgi:uncharacterized membrane protein YidH (DUF202 family)
MRNSPALAIVLEGVGVALLVWGVKTATSLTAKETELFEGAPSNKAVALVVVGAVVTALGLVRLVRRTSAKASESFLP